MFISLPIRFSNRAAISCDLSGASETVWVGMRVIRFSLAFMWCASVVVAGTVVRAGDLCRFGRVSGYVVLRNYYENRLVEDDQGPRACLIRRCAERSDIVLLVASRVDPTNPVVHPLADEDHLPETAQVPRSPW